MTRSDQKLAALIAELQEVLAEERVVLLSGKPEQITGVAARKLALAEQLESEYQATGAKPPGPEALIALERYNRGNSMICAAMIRHLSQTIDRLRRQECHRSYRPDGAENSPPAPNPLGAA